MSKHKKCTVCGKAHRSIIEKEKCKKKLQNNKTKSKSLLPWHINAFQDTKQVEVDGLVMVNTHDASNCAGEHCVIHNQSDHHMREWELTWRSDRKIFERTCEHGIGHPDPDQFDYWRKNNMMSEAVHGCDGCCQP